MSSLTYFEMAVEAILSLKDRTGSSTHAIRAYITSTYPKVDFKSLYLRNALKKGVEAEKLIMVKASYKVNKEVMKPKKTVTKAATPKKKAAPKKAAPKKAAPKKAAPKKAAPKKPAKKIGAKKAAPKKKAATKKPAAKKAAPKKK